eukprot:5131071-Pyramimonas_sp.AAC.1
MQATWCRLCGATRVVQAVRCEQCGVSSCVVFSAAAQRTGRPRGAHGRAPGETSRHARPAHEALA